MTTQFLPDYPSKDETSWPSGINAEEGNFTLRVCVHTTKTEADFVSYIHRLFDDKQTVEHSKIDEQGRFEVRMPVNGPTLMGIHNESEHPLEHTFWGRLAVENNDTLLLYIDDVNQRTYLMGGKYARFNNELLGGDFHPKFVNTNELAIDSTIIQQRHWMTVCQTRMDSLIMTRPNLSHRFLTYYQDNIQRQFGYPMLLKCCWPSQGEDQEELLRKTEEQLNALQWMRSEVPLMCRNGFSINIGYYTSTLTDIKSDRLLTDPDVFLLRLHQEGKVQLTDEEMQKVKNFAEIEKEVRTHRNTDVSLYNVFQSDIIPILGKPLIAQYWDWDISEKYVPLEISILNSLDLDDTTCEILKVQTIMRDINGKSHVASPRILELAHKEVHHPRLIQAIDNANQRMRDIDGKSHVASPRILELAHQEVHHPRLIQAIDNANQRIIDFLAENEHQEVVAPKSGSPASMRVPEEELKDITDGKALFEHITAPFRGHVIYVDVWGTWCGPCRGQMEYVPALKKMLEGKPVVYLYFCNNSPNEAWRIYIRQNHLDTDNAIHYNLPKTQESAIEQYLEVSVFPTYRLVDTTGRLVPGGAPWPSNPSAVVAAIEQLLNK